MKLRLIASFLGIGLCILPAASSAQFWKSERKSKRNVPQSKSRTGATKPQQKAAESAKAADEKPRRRKRDLKYSQSKKKDRYRIDVLVPLYLDETVKGDKLAVHGRLPEHVMIGLNIYEGIKLAADTLNGMGYATDIFVHDIAGSAQKVKTLIERDSFANSDLIIGFTNNSQTLPVADFARKHEINFVSAMSSSDAGQRENPYFLQMNPTLEVNCTHLAKTVSKKRSREFLIVYKRSKNSLDSSAFSYVASDLRNFTAVDADKMPDSASLAAVVDAGAQNMVVMPVMDPGTAENYIAELHRLFPDTRFEIFGMPTWRNMASSKRVLSFGDHVALNFTQPYYFDPTVSAGMALSEQYKRTFSGKPSEMTYRSYELIYWMTDLVNKYGAHFNEKTQDDGMAVFTPFKLKPKWDEDNNFYYIENTNLYLYRYVAGNLLVE